MRRLILIISLALALIATVVACQPSSSQPAPQQAPGAMSATLDLDDIPGAELSSAMIVDRESTPGVTRSQTSVEWRFQDGLCIDDGQGKARAWACHGGSAQAFWGVDTYVGNGAYIISENERVCLDAPSSKVWSAIVLAPCSLHYFRERWYFDDSFTPGYYVLKNEVSGLCLQDPYDLYEHVLSVYPCYAGEAERVWPYSTGTPI